MRSTFQGKRHLLRIPRRSARSLTAHLQCLCLVRLPSERARGAQGGVPHRCAGNGRQRPGLGRPHSRGESTGAESGRPSPGRLRPLIQDLAFWPRVKRAVVHGHSCRPAVQLYGAAGQQRTVSTVQYSTAAMVITAIQKHPPYHQKSPKPTLS